MDKAKEKILTLHTAWLVIVK